MQRSLYVVLFERSFDSSMDWGERASVERPFAADHLQRYRRSRRRNTERETIYVGSCVLYLMFGEL
jgi:hypothetical protein